MPLLGTPTSRNHFLNALEANLRKGYVERYNIVSKDSKISRIYNMMDSDTYIERFTVNAGLGTYPMKPEGGNFEYDSPQEAWSKALTHVEYALGVQATMTAMEDDLHGILKSSLKANGGALADVAAYTKERDSMDLFNTYLTSGTAYSAGGSTYSVLSTAHFRVDGGTWSNKPTASIDFSIEALEFAITHWMANQKNQRGQISAMMPTMVMVGSADAILAKRVLKATKQPGTADNDPNVAGDMVNELLIHQLLTNDGRWMMFCPKEERRLPYIDRVRPNIFKQPDGDNGNSRWVGRYRESHGLVDPAGLWGSD